MTKIKICGLSRAEDIEYVNCLKPDYIGFVFAASPRQVSVQKAQTLKSRLHSDMKAVGVFVNDKIDKIAALCKNNIIDVVQLHGNEDAEYIKALRSSMDKQIVKAVGLTERFDLPRVSPDYFLFDNVRGGSGKTFDWSLLEGYDQPYFLAGGLQADNVVNAIKTLSPYCVDISSGAEIDGKKDLFRIQKIIDLVRRETI